MKNFMTLFHKELVESLRNGKWIWLPIAFIIIGISQPLANYYMPQILKSAGNMPEGTVIEIPTPTGEEVLSSTLSQFGSIGTLLFVLAAMGVIANERQNGSLTLVMVRPVSPFQYIVSKWAALLLISIVSLFLSYGLTWYYTNLLFNPVKWDAMLLSFAVYSLWVVFIISITILIGTVLKSAGGIAGVSILILGGLSLASGLFTKYTVWSPSNLRLQASGVLLEGELLENGWIVTGTTLGLSVLLIVIAALNFRRFEQF